MPDYRKTILEELGASLKNVKETEIAELAERILEAGKIFCDGLGRSRLVMQGFAMRLVQMGLKGVMVGEATAPAFGIFCLSVPLRVPQRRFGIMPGERRNAEERSP